MSVTCSFAMKLGCRETIETGVDAAATPVVTLTGFDTTATLTATSTVPATKVAFDSAALTAGAYTLDLTNTVGFAGAARDFTGLKVQLFKFKNTGTNVMTVSQGGSNPYNLFGNTSFTIPVLAGQEIMFYGKDLAPDVASGAKNIAIAGTGAETFDFIAVAG